MSNKKEKEMRDRARLVDELYFRFKPPSVEDLLQMYRINDDRRKAESYKNILAENYNNIIAQTTEKPVAVVPKSLSDNILCKNESI